jgi:putative hemolysin
LDEPDSTFIRLIISAILLGFSGFFSACEAAFFSLNPLQLETLKEKGKTGELVYSLLQEPRRLLVSIYIGNEIVNVAISAIATSIAYQTFGNIGVSLAIGAATFLLLLFGEIIPKTLSMHFAESYVLFAARPLKLFFVLVQPLQKFLILFSEFMMKMFGWEEKEKSHHKISDEEIKVMVDIGEEAGGLEAEESRMIQNVINFGETTAEEIMTPKIEMFTLKGSETLEEALPKIIKNFYSRVPVYEEEGEEIAGILFTKEINRLKSSQTENAKLKNCLHPPHFVPQSKNIKELLQEFKKLKKHMAIVLDEFGSVCGLITLEDILEQLVGEIDSEMRQDESSYIKLNHNQYEVAAALPLHECNEIFQSQLPDQKFDTIGGMVFGLFGRVPRSGESVKFENFKFVVQKMKGSRILQLSVTIIEQESKRDDESPVSDEKVA